MRISADHVRVSVPATSGNLGPGFDALGMALGLRDELEVRAVASRTVELEIEGEGADTLPRDESHLVVQAIRAALDHVGASQTGLAIRATNRIPHGRGLGSSAAAVVAGITAARAMIAEPEALGRAEALRLATAFEGHPDNAAPAIYGGATVAWTEDGAPRAAALEVGDQIETSVLVPAATLPTKEARAVLPSQVPHTHAAFNAGRSALLVHALAGRPELLFDATEDRLHQGYRANVLGPATVLLRHLRDRGLAAVISGAGPSVLVIGEGLDAAGLGAGLPAALQGIGDSGWRAFHTVGRVAGASGEPVGV
ncbi:homoserine kinase [Demequina capsici]|uniref:Homoserine kinase n=1 Tax=Demequina capsici TaxID=3075620 RepID=A0AA96J642_9MICO|nr:MULTISPECIES: homoserine kinase [unclassified Demequina]WNM23817.1 homoserine kinase [Demequina sp. OYTSA14]WNM26656.1 homoserine kinase [Demequina sp. PMTSA13]